MHGWREFAGEIAIIVVGVLIALSAEQAVEQIHWHHATEQAMEGMEKDAGTEHWAVLSRYKQEQCIQRRLSDLGALFARHDSSEQLGRLNPIGRPFYNTGSAPSWDVAVADGSVSHLDFADRSRFAKAFGVYQLYERQMWEEKRAWQQLQMLNHTATLSPSDWSQARQAYDLASDFDASFRITLPQYLESFAVFPIPAESQASKPSAFQVAEAKRSKVFQGGDFGGGGLWFVYGNRK